MNERPLLLVDVDGVLNPFFRCSPPYCKCHPEWIRRKTYPWGLMSRVRLNPAHGKLLTGLADETGAELAWATTWAEQANIWISPLLGLPDLPYAPCTRPEEDRCYGRQKAGKIVPWTGGRPFVWFDDETDAAEAAARLAGDQPHRVVQVDPRLGLTQDRIDVARAWLERLG